jgi:transposase-like protein
VESDIDQIFCTDYILTQGEGEREGRKIRKYNGTAHHLFTSFSRAYDFRKEVS